MIMVKIMVMVNEMNTINSKVRSGLIGLDPPGAGWKGIIAFIVDATSDVPSIPLLSF